MTGDVYSPKLLSNGHFVSGLADKTTDAGVLVPQGRIDKHWSKVVLDAKRIGVKKVSDLPDHRIPSLVLSRYNLRSIEFGNWLNEQQRQEMLYGVAASLDTLSRVLDCSIDQTGMNGFLGVALGARGNGGDAKAHFEPAPASIINLTKNSGKGSFAHEYAHAIDNMVSYYTGCKEWCSGSGSVFAKKKALADKPAKTKKLFDPALVKYVHNLPWRGYDIEVEPWQYNELYRESEWNRTVFLVGQSRDPKLKLALDLIAKYRKGEGFARQEAKEFFDIVKDRVSYHDVYSTDDYKTDKVEANKDYDETGREVSFFKVLPEMRTDAARRQVKQFEDQIRNLSWERSAYFIWRKGEWQLYTIIDGQTRSAIDVSKWADNENDLWNYPTLYTHNHPNNGTFSQGDVGVFLNQSTLVEMRAVGLYGTYVLRKLSDQPLFTIQYKNGKQVRLYNPQSMALYRMFGEATSFYFAYEVDKIIEKVRPYIAKLPWDDKVQETVKFLDNTQEGKLVRAEASRNAADYLLENRKHELTEYGSPIFEYSIDDKRDITAENTTAKTDFDQFTLIGLSSVESGEDTPPAIQSEETFADLFQRVFDCVLYDEKGKPTNFHNKLRQVDQKARYYQSRVEVWARVFETWVSYNQEDENEFLSKPVDYYKDDPAIYPSEKDIQRADETIRALVGRAFALFKERAPAPELQKFQTGSTKTTVQTQDGELPGEFLLLDLDEIVTSHNPANFSVNSDYPAKCQQRSYHDDAAEQYKVVNGARNFKPEFVINTAPTATDGTPIVTAWPKTKKRIVLGGNGRSMMLQLLRDYGNYSIYVDYLSKNIHLFGYSPEDLQSKKYPVLVRQIDSTPDKCAYYSNVLNKGFTQTVDTNTEAVSLARQITIDVMEEIASVMADIEAETMADVWRQPMASRLVINVLKRAKVITPQNTTTFLDRHGNLDDKGKLIIERVFLAAILEDTESIEAAKSYTTQILRVAPLLLQLKRYNNEWNLIPKIKEVIRYEYERRSSGMKKADFIAQITFDRPNGITGSIVDLWNLIDAGQRKFSEFVSEYVSTAAVENQTTDRMDFIDPISADQVIKKAAMSFGLSGLSDDVPAVTTPKGEPVAQPTKIVSAADVKNYRYKPVRLDHTEKFFGDNVPPNFDMVIWGDMYQGKSSLALMVADDLALNGPVLLNQAEEDPQSASFAERMEKTGTTLRNVDIVHLQNIADLDKLLQSGKYQYVMIDSVQRMTRATPTRTTSQRENELLDWFIKNQGKYGIVLIARKDKYLSTSAGRNDWLFDANIVVKVDGGQATLMKNRYMSPIEVKNKKFNVWK